MGAPGTPNGRMWDELRKEARRVEADVDARLALYSRLGASTSYSTPSLGLSSPPPPDLAEAEHVASEIERLLEQLKVINGAMSECARGSSSDLLNHTMARHTDILHEFTQEFLRTRKNVTASLQHALLMGPISISRSSSRNDGLPISMDPQQALLRERQSMQSATAKADEVIGQAQATASSLHQQRGLFSDMFGKVSDVSSKFPTINSLLTGIRRKRSRDNIIISGVIIFCSILMLAYWLTK
eukprot:TRINITY_DN23452_c0_g1_i1.p1 TRINITY_DN23452_c0_g1~~TRINITY_DN23452_c0_g1_i1.p1  ORF type:complete len:242 (+),score=42.12 TRINITY_DN23452_c0_g1_i1:1103-1828(+)